MRDERNGAECDGKTNQPEDASLENCDGKKSPGHISSDSQGVSQDDDASVATVPISNRSLKMNRNPRFPYSTMEEFVADGNANRRMLSNAHYIAFVRSVVEAASGLADADIRVALRAAINGHVVPKAGVPRPGEGKAIAAARAAANQEESTTVGSVSTGVS